MPRLAQQRAALRTGPGAPLPLLSRSWASCFLSADRWGTGQEPRLGGVAAVLGNLVTCFFFSLKKVKKEKRR